MRNVKLYNETNKEKHKINFTSLKESKTHTLVSKLLNENHNKSKKTVYNILKNSPFFT